MGVDVEESALFDAALVSEFAVFDLFQLLFEGVVGVAGVDHLIGGRTLTLVQSRAILRHFPRRRFVPTAATAAATAAAATTLGPLIFF